MNRTEFNVLSELSTPIDFNALDITYHFSDERSERHQKIVEQIGDGNYITSFVVDTAHPNGNEIHNIFDNGIIVIQNERTKKVVTELIARPQQIKRYWDGLGKDYPRNIHPVIEQARQHQINNFNNW